MPEPGPGPVPGNGALLPAGITLFSLGFPLLQPGPGGSEHPLPLPGPAKAAGAHYSIGKEFGAAF